MKKSIFIIFAIILYFPLLSQTDSKSANFQTEFYLQAFEDFGSLYGSENKNLKLPEAQKDSFITDDLWGHIMPKNGEKNTITVSSKELIHFAKLSNCNIQFSEETFRKPEHWEKFSEISREVSFNPAITLLLIFENAVELISVESFSGQQYLTYYPFGNYGNIPDFDINSIPIIYTYPEKLVEDPLMTFLISDYAKSKLDIDKINVKKQVNNSCGNDETIIIRTTVDFNNDGQVDALKFDQISNNLTLPEEDEMENFEAKFIAILYKRKWYRTSFTETGQDGIEGF